jgi:hypothetical protein
VIATGQLGAGLASEQSRRAMNPRAYVRVRARRVRIGAAYVVEVRKNSAHAVRAPVAALLSWWGRHVARAMGRSARVTSGRSLFVRTRRFRRQALYNDKRCVSGKPRVRNG